MKEIEILVRVNETDSEKALNQLRSRARFQSEKRVKDVYYYDELRKNLQPNEKMEIFECFRLREKGGKNFITYKVDRFDQNGVWLYSDEEECSFDDMSVMTKIIQSLGLKPLVVVDMKKYFFETEEYKIALEEVEQLGSFLEVESKNDSCSDVALEHRKIQEFIDALGIDVSPDVGVGKPELLLKKNGIYKGDINEK